MRVVRFYVNLLLLLLPLFVLLLRRLAVSSEPRPSALCMCSLPDLNRDRLRSVFPAGPQPRPSALSVPCRTSTTTICDQCSLPDLNRDSLRSVFPAGPQPRPSAQCSLPDLNRDHLCSVFPAGPQPRPSARSVPCRTSTAR